MNCPCGMRPHQRLWESQNPLSLWESIVVGAKHPSEIAPETQ